MEACLATCHVIRSFIISSWARRRSFSINSAYLSSECIPNGLADILFHSLLLLFLQPFLLPLTLFYFAFTFQIYVVCDFIFDILIERIILLPSTIISTIPSIIVSWVPAVIAIVANSIFMVISKLPSFFGALPAIRASYFLRSPIIIPTSPYLWRVVTVPSVARISSSITWASPFIL